MTNDILLATTLTDTPTFCAVVAMAKNTAIKKMPNNNEKINQSFVQKAVRITGVSLQAKLQQIEAVR